jgi:hypothetical protein
VDIAFLKRVYRTSMAVWLFSLLWCWAFRSLTGAVGVTLGFGISLGSLMLLERLVTVLFTPETAGRSNRVMRKLLAVALVKYAVIGLILWVTLRFGWANPIGIIVGVGLPQVVIFLKALGKAIDFGPEPSRR